MKNLIAIVFVMLTGLSVVLAGGPESDDLLNAATCVVDETAQRSYSTSQSGEKKISYASVIPCLLYTSPSPRDRTKSRMPSSA